MRRARIVCTIGPATESPEQIQALVDAGMDVARLNRSHGATASHEAVYRNVRAAATAAGRPVAVLVYLQGPKIRLGTFADGPVDLEVGDVLTITTDDVAGTKDRVSTTFKGLPGDVHPGDPLLIDDGKVQVRVTAVEGDDVITRVEVPGLSRILEGEFRPGHFEGVTTVVAKLFHIVEPQVAVFGAKDYQQLTVIRRMVDDLCMPVEIIAAPTVRDTDGLAMSSRNQYLTAAERTLAPRIYRTLQAAAHRIGSGDADFAGIEREGFHALEEAGFRPDYFAVRQADTLLAPAAAARNLVVLTAARLGRARLIDNVQVMRFQRLVAGT